MASEFYHRPVFGWAYKAFSREMVSVTAENISEWVFKKKLDWRGRCFILFANAKGDRIMQSLQAIKFIRLRPGEENFSSKLTNAQSNEIFVRSNEGESRQDLAAEFGISPGTVSDIKNLKTRVRTTLKFLNGDSAEAQKSEVVQASRAKGKKLSASLAKFIRTDKERLNYSNKDLAKKYCVSLRTIQRIIKGDMYAQSN